MGDSLLFGGKCGGEMGILNIKHPLSRPLRSSSPKGLRIWLRRNDYLCGRSCEAPTRKYLVHSRPDLSVFVFGNTPDWSRSGVFVLNAGKEGMASVG